MKDQLIDAIKQAHVIGWIDAWKRDAMIAEINRLYDGLHHVKMLQKESAKTLDITHNYDSELERFRTLNVVLRSFKEEIPNV